MSPAKTPRPRATRTPLHLAETGRHATKTTRKGEGIPRPPKRPPAVTWAEAKAEPTATGWRFTVPVLASANRLWRSGAGRTYKAPKAAADTRHAIARLRCAPIRGDVCVRIVWIRERAAGDLDNRAKAALDLLQAIGAIPNDDAVACLHMHRLDDRTAPSCLLIEVESVALAHALQLSR